MDVDVGIATDQAGARNFQVPEVIAKQLAQHLEDMIIFGELAPGQHIVEEDIVREFRVSRSPIREALRLLEQEGLVVKEFRHGVWVTPIGLEDLDDLYACRILLESLAADLAAQHCTAEDLRDIHASVERLAGIQADKTADIREFFRENLRLATKIHAAARNKTLKRLLGSVRKQSHRYRYLAYSHIPAMMAASVKSHRELLAAMEKHNAKQARAIMEAMMQRSWKAIRDYLLEHPKADANSA